METGQWTDPGIHGWVFVQTVDQVRDGRFRYTRIAKTEGELADALLLVRCDGTVPTR